MNDAGPGPALPKASSEGIGLFNVLLLNLLPLVRTCTTGDQRLAIASRTAGTTSCAQRFRAVSLMLSPGGSK